MPHSDMTNDQRLDRLESLDAIRQLAAKYSLSPYHELFPSWKAFWEQKPNRDTLPEVAKAAPIGQFLKTMRRNAKFPKIKVR